MYRLIFCAFGLLLFSCSKSPQEIKQERQLRITEFRDAVKFRFQMLNNDAKNLQNDKNPSYNTYDYDDKTDFILLISDFPKEPLRAKVVYKRIFWLYDPHGGHFEKNIYPEEGYWRPTIMYEVEEFFEYYRKLVSLGITKELPLERPWQLWESPNPLTDEAIGDMIRHGIIKGPTTVEEYKKGLPEVMKGNTLKKKSEQDTEYR